MGTQFVSQTGKAHQSSSFIKDLIKSERATVPAPDAIKPFRAAPPEEQLRRAHVVLLEARSLYKDRAGALSDCLQQTSADLLSIEFARRLLRTLTFGQWNPFTWEQDPTRKRADVYRLLDAAIRRSRQWRGGWFVALPGGLDPK